MFTHPNLDQYYSCYHCWPINKIFWGWKNGMLEGLTHGLLSANTFHLFFFTL